MWISRQHFFGLLQSQPIVILPQTCAVAQFEDSQNRAGRTLNSPGDGADVEVLSSLALDQPANVVSERRRMPRAQLFGEPFDTVAEGWTGAVLSPTGTLISAGANYALTAAAVWGVYTAGMAVGAGSDAAGQTLAGYCR